MFRRRIELLQEYIQALGYPVANKTGAAKIYELNEPTTPSHREPQDIANQSEYKPNDDATACPQSGAYGDSGSRATLSNPDPAPFVARPDGSIVPNSRTRGIKRTQNDYMEDT